MTWNEELQAIPIRTLFYFFGKVGVAALLWYLIALIPLIIIAIVVTLSVTQ